ncbi:MAG: hypothetical protein QOE70_5311 [Chthoniobacter sp.]|jgi:hypothetical protein|nr:hypothetical protein [Chthoniobacter sp.]
MSDVALPLYAETISGNLVTSEGSAFALPNGKLGDTWICSLRFLEKQEDAAVERSLNVAGIKAAIGPVLAAPTSGKFKLKLGEGEDETTTDEISYGSTAEEMLAALGTGVGLSCSKPDAGCWVVRLTDDGENAAPLAAADESVSGFNTLSPQSFVRVRQYEEGGVWYHEIRLIQTPYAFADTSETVLPEPPEATRVLAGVEETPTEPPLNEIQKLFVPVEFAGTYYLTWGGRRSAVLGSGAGIDEIAEALNGMFDDGAERFKVTNPEKRYAYIEFVGALKAAPQSLIAVEVNTAAAGALTFRLPLDRPALHAALRTEKTVTTVFEIEVRYIGADEEIENADTIVRRLTVQSDVKLVRELIYDELALIPSHNWLRPYRRSYVPFSPDAVITGSQYARFVIGDGESEEITITHGMATDEIANVLVRENVSGGRVLGPGEFNLSIDSEDEITLSFHPAPANNSLVVIISTINNVATFQDHQHRIGQIIGDTDGAQTLRQELNALSARLTAIESLVTITGGLSKTEAKDEDLATDLPKRTELFPGRYASIPDLNSKLKAAGLLPAIHDAAVTAFTTLPLPDAADFAGSVFYNDTGAAITIPGGLGRRAADLADGGFFGSDGRLWYRLTRNDATNSYFPTDFERELWMLAINDKMLRPGFVFRVDGDLKIRLAAATTRMQCLLVIEIGEAPSQGTPSPTSLNLQDVQWDTETPLLEQRIIIGDVEQKHSYGAAVAISATATVTGTKFIYGASAAADNAPSSGNFVIRARLKDFDTENSIPGAKGLIWYESTGKSDIQ